MNIFETIISIIQYIGEALTIIKALKELTDIAKEQVNLSKDIKDKLDNNNGNGHKNPQNPQNN